MATIEDAHALDQLCVDTIRTLAMDAVQRANSGHPGAPMALAPLAHVLYGRVMRHSPGHPEWPGRDRFVLSAGHASMLLYAMLYLTGYGLSLDDLKRFRQLGSRCPGHPERGVAPGIEMTTGPLGQGISTAVGLALGERMLAARLNRSGHEIVDHRTFVIASDGDLQEGISSEACSLAGYLGLGRLTVFYDDNHISIEGDTALAFGEDVPKRFEAYGWHVQDLGEDLALDSIEAAAAGAAAVEDRPSLVVLRTHIATGSPNKQDTGEAHGSPLGEHEIALTKAAYGWPSTEPFHVPAEPLARFREAVGRGEELVAAWERRIAAYGDEHPEARAELDRIVAGRPSGGLDTGLPRFDPSEEEAKPLATRKASSVAIQWAAERTAELVGGSADLAPSTLTLIEEGGSVGPGEFAGRNLHFGIREHAMGAIVNGLNLHGLRAYGATFLIFSDYMRAAVRLAALMRLPSIFVFTHDSIGLGEDGPTHQPVEQLAGLRAMPNLYVIRPADANETALAWRFALEQSETPCALALTRQAVPLLDPGSIPLDAVDRGAYVLREGAGAGCELILIATGSEVALCLEAADLLESEGVATRVVSMPCVERFAEQDRDYRDSVLAPEVTARVAVEAASPFGWARWAGERGEVVAMESFGESAPAAALFEHFGFTPERVAQRGHAVVERERAGAAGPGA